MSVCFLSEPQVKFMKRIAEMSDLSQVIRILPRIKKHLLNPDTMRWVLVTAANNCSSTRCPFLYFVILILIHNPAALVNVCFVAGVPSTRLLRKCLTQPPSWRRSCRTSLETEDITKLSKVTSRR